MIPHANAVQAYWHQIKTGEATVGKWIRMLYEHITEQLKAGEVIFDEKKATRAIRFIENFCHHSKGRNDLIKLELWQKAAVSLIFGVVDENGCRIYRECVIIIGRKNGKSILASAIAAYMAYLDDEYGAEIYCLGPKLDQARIVYDGIYQIIKAEPELMELAKKRRSDIYLEGTNTTIKMLAFNSKKSDGFNPHGVICDEIASWPAAPGLAQYEVMKSAFGSRNQPLMLSISTAGYVSDGIYDELIRRCTAVLQGNSKERRLLPILYMIDDINKWDDIEELKKANPNMGVSVKVSFFEEEIEIARNSMSKRVEFLTKYCNIKQNSVVSWLPFKVVEDVSGEALKLEDFRGCYCVGGIDLSQTTDLTACCVVIEKEGRLHVFCQFFMPKNKVEELQELEGVPYRLYVQRGWIRESGENYVLYQDCFDWFVELVEKYEILPLKVGYDRYSSQYLIQDMNGYGFHTDDVYQGENLTPVLHECDGLLRDGTLRLGDNNLLQAHFVNVAVKQNTENRKIRPVKIEPKCHIDGFVSVIDALTVRQKWYDQIGEQLKNCA